MYAAHILIICAAPGDDVVGATAAILRARQQGYRVSALMMTNGVVHKFSWRFWEKENEGRRAERIMVAGRQCAGALGHEFMAWNLKTPVGGLWKNLPKLATYLQSAIRKLEPDVIWVPAFMGVSPDHDALNLAVSRARGHIETFEFVAIPITPDSQRIEIAFPERQGLIMPLNIAEAEADKRRSLIGLLQRAGANVILHEAYREMFRLLIKHDYTRPQFGYVTGPLNNPGLRAKAAGARIVKKVVPYFTAFLKAGWPAKESQ